LKRVPSDAPIEFVSPRWEPHVVSVTGALVASPEVNVEIE